MKSLSEFFDLVEARIQEESPGTAVLKGREYLGRRDEQGTGTANRIVIAPGRPEGKRGEFGPPRHTHVLAKPDKLRHQRFCTVQIWGYDATSPANSMAHDDALEALVQLFMRSAQYVLQSQGHALHTLYQAEETYPLMPRERRHGDMCQIVFAVGFNVRAPTPAAVVDNAAPSPVTQHSTMASGEVTIEVYNGS